VAKFEQNDIFTAW